MNEQNVQDNKMLIKFDFEAKPNNIRNAALDFIRF